jgi:hypothetical protein
MRVSLNKLAAGGLALGASFGLAGTLVAQDNLRHTLWGIDSLGLVMAAALLTLKFFRKGDEDVAAGFLIFAIGEAVILGGTAAPLEVGIPPFAAGSGLWATALLLISIPPVFSLAVRLAGLVTSVLFFIVSFSTFSGHPLSPLSKPLPFFAYPLLVLTFIGWIWTLLREP